MQKVSQRYKTGDSDLAWTGERQVGRTLDDIRPDHVARYRHAARFIPSEARVLDAGCGVGYGAAILADSVDTAGAALVESIDAIDASPEAIAYARKHWNRAAIRWRCASLLHTSIYRPGAYEAIVAFEILEHVKSPAALLGHFCRTLTRGGLLIGSSSNQAVRPFESSHFPFHQRHYTQGDLVTALREARFTPFAWWAQDVHGPELAPLRDPDREGQVLVFMATRK